jgi:adenylate cyclase
MAFKKYTNNRLKNCLKAGILGLILTSISLVEDVSQAHWEYPFIGFISGFFTGIFELFVYRERLRNLNFIVGLLIKAASYTLTVYLLIVVVLGITSGITGNIDIKSELQRFIDKDFFLLLWQAFKGSIIIVFLLQLDVLLGDGAFRRYMSGKFHKPKKQNMVFMFLDMKGSTKMAETLGDEKYYSLIDDFFHDISRPIIESEAEIYKYVGDEVIIMWPLEKGLKYPTCIDLFFYIRRKVRRRKEYYMAQYGMIPEFKAGLHAGTVVSAIIGDIRKEIVYSGDVLNTASRLQESCNEMGVDILISDTLKTSLAWSAKYNSVSKGKVLLKGKIQEMEIFTVIEN